MNLNRYLDIIGIDMDISPKCCPFAPKWTHLESDYPKRQEKMDYAVFELLNPPIHNSDCLCSKDRSGPNSISDISGINLSSLAQFLN